MANPIFRSQYTAAQIESLIGHGVPIVQNGTWWTWDVATSAYVDTGASAEGAEAWHGIADDFSDAASYAVGDLVIYNGELYVCTTAHTGAWDAADFAATTVAAQLKTFEDDKSIALGAYPHAVVSGAVASFADGADDIPVRSLTAQIVPQQEAGTPSPENPLTISGWTETNACVSGINLWDEVWEPGSIDSNTGVNIATGTIRSKNYIPVKPGMHIYGYSGSTTTAGGCRYYAKDKSYIGQRDANGLTGIFGVERVVPDNCYFIRWNAPGAYPSTYQHDISINYPATNTEYHAYNGNTYAVVFPASAGTVYGGSIRYNGNGAWTLKSKPYYASYNGETLIGPWVSSMDVYGVGVTPTTGAQVVDLGGAETEFTISADSVKTLMGYNNIFADCGDVSVDYRADTTLYINAKVEALTALMSEI